MPACHLPAIGFAYRARRAGSQKVFSIFQMLRMGMAYLRSKRELRHERAGVQAEIREICWVGRKRKEKKEMTEFSEAGILFCIH